jgi:choline dehydrogenase-like flavoprotein
MKAAAGVLSNPPDTLGAEVLVIGSGPGGATTAALLAEAGRKVLIVEEGPLDPPGACEPFSLEEMARKYRNGGLTPALGNPAVAYVEGRCVGGGSEINSGLYHRTPPDILEKWRQEFRVEAATEQDLAPHFEAIERELSVSLLREPAPAASLKLHEGAARLGWKSLEVPRWFKYSPDQPRGKRQSMSETFIPRALAADASLLPDTRVFRLRREGSGWLALGRHRSGRAVGIRCEQVFICAGAIQTPALLRRSGLGGNAGNSLQLHPTVKIVARFPDVVNTRGMGVPVHQVKEFAPKISLGCSISSPPHLALSLLDRPTRETAMEAWPHMAIYYAMITTPTTGTVRLLPGFSDAVVRYPLNETDRRALAAALKTLARALFAAGAEVLHPGVRVLPPIRNAAGIERLPETLPAAHTSVMTIHLFSSCPMGEERRRCAVDSFGRVHGQKGLHVADASLLCTAPGVNPQGSVMAFARRNACHFLGRL